jgi:hypothetical protein
MIDQEISLRAALNQSMPSMLRHEGLWEGDYHHFDSAGALIDQHRVRIRCEFPDSGPYAYIQHNLFTWPDGRQHRAVLPGVLQGDRLYWDVDTFHGYAWETRDGILLLNLTRKDEPGAHFCEMIVMGADGTHRARSWQWFRGGKLFKLTMCNEWRVE